jgi:hypothetical protein
MYLKFTTQTHGDRTGKRYVWRQLLFPGLAKRNEDFTVTQTEEIIPEASLHDTSLL